MSELTPHLCVGDARRAVEWYREALGAEVVHEPIVMPDGRVGHVELEVAGARWMMADPFPEIGVEPPGTDRGAAVSLHLTVDDVDEVATRVTAAGVRLDRGPEDDVHAGRVAVFRDPFGHRWFIGAQEGADPARARRVR
ncbi:hypothetical protein GCM10009809_15040 [Isoptericola hypogeus]|uniref:VOC domain-containing protein n=1 Tax=Isoptericola hypogeus TaxID=300179 RepID=A0ABP4V9P6_9MICO